MSSDDYCVIEREILADKIRYAHRTRTMSYYRPLPLIDTRFFWSLEEAITWHNKHCNSEYGLSVNFNLEDVMPVEEKKLAVETFSRKVFEVQAIQVDEDNMEHIANWCGGKVSTTKTGVPFIDVPPSNPKNQIHSRAFVGSWVVTGREGHFSSYADRTFHRTFERG